MFKNLQNVLKIEIFRKLSLSVSRRAHLHNQGTYPIHATIECHNMP